MGDLPVEHRDDTGPVDHQVAVAEVVVDQGPIRRIRQVLHQPARGEVDHRLRCAEGLVAAAGLLDETDRAEARQIAVEAVAFQVDRVQPAQNLAALPGQLRARFGEVGGAHDPRAQGDAVEPFHDEAGPELVGGLQHVEHLGPGDAVLAGDLHQLRLDAQARRAALDGSGFFSLAARRSPEREFAEAGGRFDPEAIGLLAGAAGKPLESGQALAALDLAL